MGFGNGKWDSGTGIWERGGNEASKDIAESPARSERPDKDNSQRTTDNRQRLQVTMNKIHSKKSS